VISAYLAEKWDELRGGQKLLALIPTSSSSSAAASSSLEQPN